MATTWIAGHQIGDTIALIATTNDHVDLINHTVQHARLHAGHLVAELSAPVASGEHVHVGDVIATRRNNRQLVTSQGKPVRNRDTWTVTALGHDGSLTVTHTRGHGTTTLPPEYVRDHVRLGYAATEHGHQGDTVTTAISLATTATTRRGLYVAATRGRDENLVCVVTDSTDVAEARDTLEAVLATDRADIPAVTQRRTLAEQTRPSPPLPPAPTRAVRAVIPPWFDSLVEQVRAELHGAQQRLRRHHAEHQRRVEDLARAASVLVAAEHDAAPRLRQVSVAERDAERAAAGVADAERRLANTRRRHRPAAQRDLDNARASLDAASRRLDTTSRAATPTRQRLQTARAARNEADSAVDLQRLDDTIDPPDRPVIAAHQRLNALTAWQSWASGVTIDGHQLNLVLTLDQPGTTGPHARLGELVTAVHEWSVRNRVELPAHAASELDL